MSHLALLQRIAAAIQGTAGRSRLLGALEAKRIAHPVEGVLRPIFIVGPPRTGSTILFQMLLNAYRFRFFTNLHSLFFRTPALVEAAVGGLRDRFYRPRNESMYGYTKGLLSPSEAGPLFRHWFGDDEWDRDSSSRLAPSHVDRIRRTMAVLTRQGQWPFLSKNLQNSLRLRTIDQVFPEACFIRIARDPYDTCASLLEMRKKLTGSISAWASIKPPTFRKLGDLSPYAQVARQVLDTERYIDRFFDDRENPCFNVNYAELLSDPRRVVEACVEWLGSRSGHPLAVRHAAALAGLERQVVPPRQNPEIPELRQAIDATTRTPAGT